MNIHLKTIKFVAMLTIALGNAGIVVAQSLPSAALATAPLVVAPDPRADQEVSVFYDDLAPHGEWMKIDRYGWCWRPHGVAVGWRPYTTGHWVFADECGWTWVADEEWGWAPFHYGRWFWDDGFGWCWLPGTEWGPAWVAWRSGGGYCGWRPLPPECGWSAGAGLSCGGIDLAVETGRPCWSFVEERFILEPRIHEHVIVGARNVTLVQRTRDVTRFEFDHDRVVNRSLEVTRVEEVTGRTIERVHIREVDSVQRWRETRNTEKDVVVYRPAIAAVHTDREPVNRPVPAIAREDLEKQQQREQAELQARHEAERKSLEEQHAREMERVPAGLTAEQIKRDHEAEQKAIEAQHRRDIEFQQRMHEMQRKQLPPPRPSPTEPRKFH